MNNVVFIASLLCFSCSITQQNRKLSSVVDTPSCSSVIKSFLLEKPLFEPFAGKPYDHLYSIEGHHVYRLGWGAEASSFRVVSKSDDKVFTRKVFNTDEEDQFYSEGTRDRELRRLSLVRDIMKGCAQENKCFQLVNVIGQESDDIIDFEYIPGRTLDWFVRQRKISADMKKEFQRTYETFSKKIIDEIQKKYGPRAINYKSLKWRNAPKDLSYYSYLITIVADDKMLKAGFEQETVIWLKPDNVLIDPFSGHMTLIDPY